MLCIFRYCKQELKKSETLLKALKVIGIAGQKQAVSVTKSVETRRKQLAALKVRSDALQLKHTNMAGLVSEGNSDVSTHDHGLKIESSQSPTYKSGHF